VAEEPARRVESGEQPTEVEVEGLADRFDAHGGEIGRRGGGVIGAD
jgi:hypothetical protein